MFLNVRRTSCRHLGVVMTPTNVPLYPTHLTPTTLPLPPYPCHSTTTTLPIPLYHYHHVHTTLPLPPYPYHSTTATLSLQLYPYHNSPTTLLLLLSQYPQPLYSYHRKGAPTLFPLLPPPPLHHHTPIIPLCWGSVRRRWKIKRWMVIEALLYRHRIINRRLSQRFII